MVRKLDLCTFSLPEESLHTELVDDQIILSTLKNIRLSIAALPNELLHALQVGVTEELRDQEQCALNLISEYWVNNEQMFTEKTQALKEKYTIQAQSYRLEASVAEAYRIVPELHISEDAQSEAKIWKLAARVREAKAEVGRVQFKRNMNIMDLKLKL